MLCTCHVMVGTDIAVLIQSIVYLLWFYRSTAGGKAIELGYTNGAPTGFLSFYDIIGPLASLLRAAWNILPDALRPTLERQRP